MFVEDALADFSRAQCALSTIATLLQLTSYRYSPQASVNDEDEFDYIVVGAGSAGSVVATRLAEDCNISVLLLEAGGDPPIESNLPSISQYLYGSKYDWHFQSQVDDIGYQCLRDQRLTLNQGKFLGGSSGMNLMWYVRGDPHDFDTWADIAKDPSWNYTNILKYFIKSERLEDNKILKSPYGRFHGTKGPVGVTKIYSDVSTKYLEAYQELGHDILLDTNGDVTLGYSEVMVTAADGIRQSTANTFLANAKHRKNLYVLRNSKVTKIIIDENNVARGVEYIDKNNVTFTVKARKEVIVSAGPINSPHLLLLSGIGPKEQLEQFDIEVVADLPVGENMKNHHGAILLFKTNHIGNVTLPPSDPGKITTPMITGFIALNKSQTYPDYQASNIIIDAEALGAVDCPVIFSFDAKVCQDLYEDAIGREVLLVEIQDFTRKPRGRVSLKSKDPLVSPDVYILAYPDEEAFETILDYAEDFVRVVNTTYFKSVGGELLTLPQCAEFDKNSREYLRCYSRCMSASLFHYISTCAMGSVVDNRLRVYGVDRLRVVDSSIMPTITSGNTNAPTMMIGEKAADMIKEDNCT